MAFMQIKMKLFFYLLISVVLTVGCACGSTGSNSNKGLWLSYRQFPDNCSRCEIPAKMSKSPEEVWSYGHCSESLRYAGKIELNGKTAYLISHTTDLELLNSHGKNLWPQPYLGFSHVVGVIPGKPSPKILIEQMSNKLILLDSRNGKELWSWVIPEGTNFFMPLKIQKVGNEYRLFVFPRGVVNGNSGFCFRFSETKTEPDLLWKKDYVGKYLANYGPLSTLADMDNDGKIEAVIASKPTYIGVIDSDTGDIKFDLAYDVWHSPIKRLGRPYGLMQLIDLDNDGFNDVVVVSQEAEKYIGVLRNKNGKQLELLWSQFIDHGFSADEKVVRPRTTSVIDINGDGKKELVLGLFNYNGDQKWHTIVIDPLKGFESKLLDLPDR
jgi:hypothetical protein